MQVLPDPPTGLPTLRDCKDIGEWDVDIHPSKLMTDDAVGVPRMPACG